MTIVVLVKQVPDMNAVRVDPATGTARVSGKAMNSYDSFAVQHALTLKEALGGDVVVVSAGPVNTKDALTRALAMGADRGVHVELNDQGDRDSLDMASVLAEAVKPLDPAVVLLGQLSDDVETGQIGPQLAELLGMPHVSSVMSVSAAGDTLSVQRDSEGGYQTVSGPLPVVVIVGSSTDEPIYPSIKGMMAARKKPVETIPAAAKQERRLSWSEPKAPQRESEGIIVAGESAPEAAARLVAWMKDNKLIAG